MLVIGPRSARPKIGARYGQLASPPVSRMRMPLRRPVRSPRRAWPCGFTPDPRCTARRPGRMTGTTWASAVPGASAVRHRAGPGAGRQRRL